MANTERVMEEWVGLDANGYYHRVTVEQDQPRRWYVAGQGWGKAHTSAARCAMAYFVEQDRDIRRLLSPEELANHDTLESLVRQYLTVWLEVYEGLGIEYPPALGRFDPLAVDEEVHAPGAYRREWERRSALLRAVGLPVPPSPYEPKAEPEPAPVAPRKGSIIDGWGGIPGWAQRLFRRPP